MKRVIFDTDIGIDDAMALLFLHYTPEIRLEAITTVSGNASIDDVTRNACYVCERFAIAAPVFRGAPAPIAAALGSGYPDFVHGSNGLGDIPIPAVGRREQGLPAAEAIVELARANPGELSLVAVGRLSNLALALQRCPELPGLLKEVVIMGGVFMRRDHCGNVSPVAEANIAGDPTAADQVLGSGLNVTLLPLDVTQETIMDETFITRLRECAGDAGAFIHAITRFYFDFYAGISGRRECPIHDSSAVAYLLSPGLYHAEQAPVRVVTEGIAMGQTLAGPRAESYAIDAWLNRPSSRFCTGVQAEHVRELYLRSLANAGS